MGWIARLSNKDTITEKDYLADDKKYYHLPLELVQSLQVMFAGNYVTVTRANDTQRLIQLKGQRTAMGKTKNPKAKTNPHVETIIICVMNKEGDAVGWSVNFEDNKIRPFRNNVIEMGINTEQFDLKLDEIIFDIPDMFIYTMRRGESDFSIR